MSYIGNSLDLVGYKARYQELPGFDLTGFTKIVQSGGEQYDAVRSDGRWEILRSIGRTGSNTIYGVASLDSQCPKGHYRYTVAVEVSADQFEHTPPYNDLFSMHVPESEWLVFEMESFATQYGRFWESNPYEMIQKLGRDFNTDAGIHIDVYAPSYISDNDCMEFWMPVKQHTPHE